MSLECNQPRIQRVLHKLKRREVTVKKIDKNSPKFISVTFYSPDLSDFVSISFDDHVKFIFTENNNEIRRDYTPTQYSIDNNELTLKFSLHDQGKAVNWARNAKIGDTAAIAGPRGSFVLPADLSWQLLIGDYSAFPAIERRLSESSRDIYTIALLLVNDNYPTMDKKPNQSIFNFLEEEQLLETLKNLKLPEATGLCWAAGEASLMKQIKGILLGSLQQPRHLLRIGAYWRRGESEFHQDLMSQ